MWNIWREYSFRRLNNTSFYLFQPKYKLADPICTFIFSVLVLITTISILRDTMNVLMEGTPKGLDFNEVRDALYSIPGVVEVHNLRMWSLTISKTACSVHLAVGKPFVIVIIDYYMTVVVFIDYYCCVTSLCDSNWICQTFTSSFYKFILDIRKYILCFWWIYSRRNSNSRLIPGYMNDIHRKIYNLKAEDMTLIFNNWKQ